MKVPKRWLETYCSPGLSPEDLCERITMGVAPIEGTEELPDGDLLLEIEVTNNRPDLTGVLGVAREVHALTGAPLETPDLDYPTDDRPVAEAAAVEVEDPDLCPRYIARVIEGVAVGPSPAWLVDRLESVGLRTVNNVVDVTNFVCLEYAQPLHAFDLDRLAGSKIVVRRARKGERMQTLDGAEHALDPDRLLIADAERGVAVAGVMGGLDSEVTAETTRILLESASFDPRSVRRTSRALDLSTESSQRFARGVAWQGIEDASRRATALIIEVAGGRARAGSIDVAAEGAGEAGEVALRFARLKLLTGVEIPPDEAVGALERLGFPAVSRDADGVTVRVGGHRTDIRNEADLIEEVLRVWGYDRVPENPRFPIFPVEPNPVEQGKRLVQDTLAGFGYREALTLSFAWPDDARNPSAWTDRPALEVLDPVRPEFAGLRRGLLGHLLQVKRTNVAKGNGDVRLFEVSRCYLAGDEGELPEEKEVIGLLADASPLALKGTVSALLDALGSPARVAWRPAGFPLFRGDACWEWIVEGRRAGILGIVSPEAMGRFDLKSGSIAGAEIDLAAVLAGRGRVRQFRALPRYPGSRRDISLIVDDALPWGAVEGLLHGLDEPILRAADLFDVYRGKQIPPGKKALAFSVTFRSDQRTLTGEEIEAIWKKIIHALTEKLGGEVRSS